MKKHLLLLLAAALITGCEHEPAESSPAQRTENAEATIIAFGSCLRQWQPQPVWQGITALKPEAFIFLGDNMYSDRGAYERQPEPRRIENAYRDLAASPEYQAFLRSAQENGTALYATWDDHDYGRNDGGGDYPHKLASKAYFQAFYGVKESASGGADRPGVYSSGIHDLDGHRVQFLLLDTRSFRSPLKKSADTAACPPTGTIANTDPGATLLGQEQWIWLENELKKDADIRIIASSIQVIPMEHCFEKWANFPAERQRLFDLLKNTGASGVVLISGDRHLAEISRLPAGVVGYPLYEITASGLNSAMGMFARGQPEKNTYRALDGNIIEDNFGTIDLVKTGKGTALKLQLRDTKGKVLQETTVALGDLVMPQESSENSGS